MLTLATTCVLPVRTTSFTEVLYLPQVQQQQGPPAQQNPLAQHAESAQQDPPAQHAESARREWGPQAPADRQYGDEEGLFVAEVGDGEEHYFWPDGSAYFGEWQDGQPHGRGIYVSSSGSLNQNALFMTDMHIDSGHVVQLFYLYA